MLRIHTIGGYDEVGKNMTALEVDEDVFLFDAGLFLPAIVGVEEREKVPTEKGMRGIGALPDDLYLEKHDLRKKVRAILVSHAHLDHVGGIPFVAPRYKAPVLSTPFTIEVLKSLLEDNNHHISNRLIQVKPNQYYTIKGKSSTYKVEFINMTHSTIQSTMIAVHTKYGAVIYANDFKFDNAPVLGDRPNYKRLKELSKSGIAALIADCLYAQDDRKTPSEKIARGMLEDVMKSLNNKGIVITTFSSHIARLKSIVDFGSRLNREIIFAGRSLNKYVNAAAKCNLAPFRSRVSMVSHRNMLEKTLKKASSNKSRYLIVCTGHQGEPGSILDRISRGKLPYKLDSGDQIIFSSKTIPTPINEASRQELEENLKKFKVRIFDNVHVSGHGGKEDLRDLLNLTQPEHFIPSHGEEKKRQAGMDVAIELGYKKGVDVHMLSNGEHLEI